MVADACQQTPVMEIKGVPQSITRAAYVDLIERLGLDPTHLRSLEFRMDGIYAEVVAVGEDGKPLLDYSRNELVQHRVFIRVE